MIRELILRIFPSLIVELEYKAVLRQVRNKLASNLQDHPRGISLVNLIW